MDSLCCEAHLVFEAGLLPWSLKSCSPLDFKWKKYAQTVENAVLVQTVVQWWSPRLVPTKP